MYHQQQGMKPPPAGPVESRAVGNWWRTVCVACGVLFSPAGSAGDAPAGAGTLLCLGPRMQAARTVRLWANSTFLQGHVSSRCTPVRSSGGLFGGALHVTAG